MPAVHDPEGCRRCRNSRLFSRYGDGVPCSRHQIVHRDAHLDQVPKDREVRAEHVGELPEDPQCLPLFLHLRFP